MPCRGENSRARAKSRLADSTMNGPVGSRVPKNERKAPLSPEIIPRQELQTNIR